MSALKQPESPPGDKRKNPGTADQMLIAERGITGKGQGRGREGCTSSCSFTGLWHLVDPAFEEWEYRIASGLERSFRQQKFLSLFFFFNKFEDCVWF